MVTSPPYLTGGTLAALVVSAAGGLGFEQAAALTVGSVAASRLPDVDARIIRGSGHRHLPHSLAFGGGGAVLVGLILVVWLRASAAGSGWLNPGTLSAAVVGATLGYLVHLALDAATKSGIWLVMPGGTRVGLPRAYAVRTGSLAELGVAAAMVALCLALGLAVFGDALDGARFVLGRG